MLACHGTLFAPNMGGLGCTCDPVTATERAVRPQSFPPVSRMAGVKCRHARRRDGSNALGFEANARSGASRRPYRRPRSFL
ncbi:protein of unknown function [Burkholderia multivorans]